MQQLEINDKRKKIPVRLGIILIIAFILLTFLSKTVDNYLMPNVTTVKYVKGSLQNEYEAQGTVEYSKKHKVIAEGNWRVKGVKVIAGQQIKKGDLLAELDNSDIKLYIKTKELEIMKLENAIQNYKDSYNPVSLSTYESELQIAEKEMYRAKVNLDSLKELYEAGAESKQNVDAAEDAYDKKAYAYNTQKDTLEEKKKESITEQNKYERALKEMINELEIKKMELEKEKSNIPEGGMLFSDIDGTVSAVNIESGMNTATNQTIFEIIEVPYIYRAVWYLESDKHYNFSINDEIIIETTGEITESGKRVFKPISLNEKVSGKIFDNESGKYKFWADISVNEDNEKLVFFEGQKVSIRSVVSSPVFEYLLPKSCVTQVGGSDCIFVVKKRQGPLGEEYYVEQRQVKILGKDDRNVAVDCFFKKGELVVASSSKPLKDMVRVDIFNSMQDNAG